MPSSLSTENMANLVNSGELKEGIQETCSGFVGRLSTTLLLYKWGLKYFGDFQLEMRTVSRAQKHRLDKPARTPMGHQHELTGVKSRKWNPVTAKAQRMPV